MLVNLSLFVSECVCGQTKRAERATGGVFGCAAAQAAEQRYGRGWAGSGTTTLALTYRRHPATRTHSTAPAA